MEEIIKINAKQKILKEKLKKEKKILHKSFFEENKKLFYFLDIVVVLCILMNFGALSMTNFMTYKEAVDRDAKIVIYEANPTMAERSNFKTVDDMSQEMKLTQEELIAEKKSINMMWVVLYQTAFFWAILIFAYIFNRTRIYNYWQMGILIFVVAFYFSLIGYDMFHDLGYFIAEVLFR